MRRGLTLVELLVVLVLVSLVLSAVYYSYVHLYRGFLSQSTTSTIQIESAIGLEVLRQDIEHAGFGIAVNDPVLPIKTEKDSDGKYHLKIHSTYNVSNDETRGWALVKCLNSGDAPIKLAPEDPFPSNCAVFLSLSGELVRGLYKYECPEKGYFLAYPVPEGEFSPCDGGGSVGLLCNQACVEIEYFLYDTTSKNPLCKDLPSLGRRVKWKVSGGRTVPIIDCVADFKVRYDWGNKKYVDPVSDSDVKSATAAEERENLKMVHIYLLVREGKYDPNYTFRGSTVLDGVELNLPDSPDALHYRWKVVKLSVEPMNLMR